MSRIDENIFGRLAMVQGWISREQFKECQEEERRAPGRGDLGQILFARGYLTEQQLGRLREVHRRKSRKLVREGEDAEHLDRAFVQVILRKEALSFGQLEAALLEQERLERLNLTLRLPEVILALGMLAEEQVLDVLRESQRSVLECPACDRYYSVGGYRSGTRYQCRRCGGALAEPRFLDAIAVDEPLDSSGGSRTKGGARQGPGTEE